MLWKHLSVTAGIVTMMTQIIRSYSDLIRYRSFKDRFEYLRLDGQVGKETFGFDRYLNQTFYHSDQWKRIRDYVISRDLGCDLGVDGYTIHGRIYIHHMNPIDRDDVLKQSDNLIDPEFLICTTHNTHNAIHYGDESLLITDPIERTPFDTCPWKRTERGDRHGQHSNFY